MTSLETIVIDWMSRKGPAEWHGVAAHWNWDNGVEPLLWILDQRGCDKATALTVFWACDPYDQMDERQPGCSPGREDHQVVHKVLARWSEYTTARFKFVLPWHAGQIHLPSYKLTPETLEKIQPMMISIGGQERFPIYDGGGPMECQIRFLETEGEPVSDFQRQLLIEEQTGQNMSRTDAESAAQHNRELQESLAEFEDILEEIQQIRREGGNDRTNKP